MSEPSRYPTRRTRLAGVAGAGLAVAGVIVTGLVAGASAAPGARDGLIAFMRPGQIGEYDIWVVRPDGKGLRRLTRSPASRSDYNPTWSPDGSVVLFERRGTPGGEDLYTVKATGGQPTQLTDCSDTCLSDGEARFSPTGAKVAFARATIAVPNPPKVSIYVASRNGKAAKQISLPPGGFEDHYPSWSPDGRTILFQRDTSTSTPGPTKLIAVNVASGKERLVYSIPGWAPGSGVASFSPDGKRILFGYWCIYGDSCPGTTRAFKNSRLATVRADGRARQVVPLKVRADSGAWSPSGKKIVFRCHAVSLSSGPFKLCTSNRNGKGLKQFPWPLGSAHPSWGTHR